jgi:hypothetical protein
MKATCPVHGVQEFERYEPTQWWWCMQAWNECQAVIPDELVTADGADPIVWAEYMRWPQYEDAR